MAVKNRVIETLDKVALLSDHPKFQMAAALVYRNTIVGIGCNRMKSHPFQARYSRNSESIFLHAEVHALKNALKEHNVDRIRGARMIIVRRTKKGYGLAKPCEGCMRAMAEFGIENVHYTTDSGGFVTLEGIDVHNENIT